MFVLCAGKEEDCNAYIIRDLGSDKTIIHLRQTLVHRFHCGLEKSVIQNLVIVLKHNSENTRSCKEAHTRILSYTFAPLVPGILLEMVKAFSS